MKKSMIVMMMMVLAFSLNLFGETETKDCKQDKMMKDCNKEMMENCKNKEMMIDHKCDHEGKPCTEECKSKASMKCDHKEGETCTEECKHDKMMKNYSKEKMENCKNKEMLKDHCSNSNEVKEEGCNPIGCGQKAVQKGCQKL